MNNIIECLEKRGFIDQITSESLKEKVEKPIKVYVGFDPTADSLHLGNLVGIIALCWFQKFGHTPYALIGGATGRIGDPSGKSIERPFLEEETIDANVNAISLFLKNIFKNNAKTSAPEAVIVNNDEWFKDILFINFMRDVGKYFRLSTMLSKESVKMRVSSEEGMSFTEFSYQVLQGYDFYHLYKKYNVELQMGGSDQWGNITSGIEYSRKKDAQTLFGLTFPLITRSDGKKFGKSEKGAIWLDEKKLSPYQFYQYLMKVPDADVIRFMKILTFMPLEEIEEIEKKMTMSDYIPNSAQQRLSEEVTKFVHTEKGLQVAHKVTETVRPGKDTKLNGEILKEIMNNMPHVEMKLYEVLKVKFIDVITKATLTTSKSEALRLVKNNGAYLNNEKVIDPTYEISEKDLIDKTFLVIAKGKKKKILIKIKN